ncbi:hypothetical protein BFS86_19845 [Shewanella algae]|nr:hypothetical protein BFS86_19845 [Shewanella algae]DAQ47177.1 MAG TPA: Chitinase A [Caudoviricetes sp.]
MNLTLGNTRLIVDSCLKHGLFRNQAAYVLATAYHETAHTMVPVREYGGETYLKSKSYYPYVGMGFVQLTWLYNYQRATKELGIDFVSDPKKLLIPAYSAEIIVLGMSEGWFTGKKLSDYMTLAASDFSNARKIVNPKDYKTFGLIAGYATQYDALLKTDGYGETPPVAPPIVTPAAPAPIQPPVTSPVATAPAAAPVQSSAPAVPASSSVVSSFLSLISSLLRGPNHDD